MESHKGFQANIGALFSIIFKSYHRINLLCLKSKLSDSELKFGKSIIIPTSGSNYKSVKEWCENRSSELTFGELLQILKQSFSNQNKFNDVVIMDKTIQFLCKLDSDFDVHFTLVLNEDQIGPFISILSEQIDLLQKKLSNLEIKFQLLKSLLYYYGEDASGYSTTYWYELKDYLINDLGKEILIIVSNCDHRADTQTSTTFYVRLDEKFYSLFKEGFSNKSLEAIAQMVIPG